MPRPLPIGITDFRKLREKGCYLVDKSMLVAEYLRDSAEVVLLPRPRRFGKTLNLSMLRWFLDQRFDDQARLFDGLEVTRHQDVMAHAGRHPVVFFSLKQCREPTFEAMLKPFRTAVATLFEELVADDTIAALAPGKRAVAEAILAQTARPEELGEALALLLELLHKQHGKRVWVLIDEYDAPIISGYQNGYYEQVISLVRNFLSGALKDNPHLERGLLTGILRVAKESIFSGLNNVKVRSILSRPYQHFGFLEEEVLALFREYDLEGRLDEVRDWYNGYRFGALTVYNPWSILQYAEDPEDGLQPHWLNTSGNDLARELVLHHDALSSDDLTDLMQGGAIEARLQESLNLRDMTDDDIWSLLLFSGYLKATDSFNKGPLIYHRLAIPNQEVWTFYLDAVLRWLKKRRADKVVDKLQAALLEGDMAEFERTLAELCSQVLSYHDTAFRPAEAIFHAFFLGLLVQLTDRFELASNREAGHGRYDVALFPKDVAQQGFLFEFKRRDEGDDLERVAEHALAQIRARAYADAMWSRGVTRVCAVGVAVDGKRIAVRHELVTR